MSRKLGGVTNERGKALYIAIPVKQSKTSANDDVTEREEWINRRILTERIDFHRNHTVLTNENAMKKFSGIFFFILRAFFVLFGFHTFIMTRKVYFYVCFQMLNSKVFNN